MVTTQPPTPADDPILAALARYHVLTAVQVQRLLYAPGSRKYAPLRLKTLVAGGYVFVDYPAPPRRAGRARGVYQLDARGRAYATEILGLDVVPRFRRSEQAERSYSFYAHVLAVNDVLIAAALLTQQRPEVTVLEEYHELSLKRAPIRLARTRDTGARATLIPDGFLLLRFQMGGQARRFPLCLEVDRGHEGQSVWQEKVRRYVAAFSGPLEQALGVRQVTVAVLAPDTARRDWLRAWTAAALASVGATPLAGRFLLSGADPSATSPETLFLAPLFVSPSEPATLESLLVAPTAAG